MNWLNPATLHGFDKVLWYIAAMMVAYALYGVISLLWRVPELVLAKTELIEMQTKYYKALLDAEERKARAELRKQ
jgi:hypothetical protein